MSHVRTAACAAASGSTTNATLTGVVLAGGLSTRLGTDKTALRLHGDDGPDMLTRTARLLAQVTDTVWISARTRTPRTDEFAWLCDEHPGLGPIGGLLTALRTAKGPVFALSCDLPYMTRAVLGGLLQARANRAPGVLMTTYMREVSGYIEPLVAIYEAETLPLFEAAVSAGDYRLRRVVDETRQLRIPYGCDATRAFFNINRPADLEEARRHPAAP